jgi:hypothetical protein
LLLNEEIASLELQLDEIEFLDLTDPDFKELLSDLQTSSDPS